MTKLCVFAKQTRGKSDGIISTGKAYPVKVGDDNEVSLRQINALRIVGFGLEPLGEGEKQDGKDVSGSRYLDMDLIEAPRGVQWDGVCSQIVWKDGKFVAVPYSKENERIGESKTASNNTLEIRVAEWMANHQARPRSKPQKGVPVKNHMRPDPILAYNTRVYTYITGRMKTHLAKSTKPLRIILTGVQGFNDDKMNDLLITNEMLGCPVEWVR